MARGHRARPAELSNVATSTCIETEVPQNPELTDVSAALETFPTAFTPTCAHRTSSKLSAAKLEGISNERADYADFEALQEEQLE